MPAGKNNFEQENKKLKQTIAELTKQRDKYKKIFDVSADAYSIIDLSSGKFIECNQSAIDMHGVNSMNNFLNLNPADLSPKLQPCGKRSDILAKNYIENAVQLGSQSFQWTHSRLDGSTFNCLVSLTAIFIGNAQLVLAVGRDISDLETIKNQVSTEAQERQRFERAYLGEKEKFEKFVDLAPVGIAINSILDGSFEFINEEFSHITGYSVEELNKMDYWQLTPEKYKKQEHEQLELLAKYGQYGPYQKEYIHKNGNVYPVLLSGIKITDSKGETFIWSVVQDITHQKESEQQIKEAKEKADSLALRMQLANDSAGIGVWEWDLITGQLVWDSWMYKLYGITDSQFSGAYDAWLSCVHPDDLEGAKKKLEDAINGMGTYDPEFRVVHPNGNVRTIKASAEILKDSHGAAIKVVGVNYDVTEQVDAIGVLFDAKLAAENAAQSKSDFLANMSHEIRTPMNAILGGLQLLKNINLPDELSVILNNASFSAQSLLTIINDILDYSKIESNQLELEKVTFSLTEVLDSITYDLDSLVSEKRIDFIINKSKSYNEYWLGDLVRVKQILLNLTSNAVKFTEKGSVKINVSSEVFGEKEAIFLEVVDSGIGMSKEVTDHIFERFTQADSSTTRKYGGTGLGMSITVCLVKMMGGEIDIQSKQGLGTTVTIKLPLAKANNIADKVPKKSFKAPNLKGKKILIAEDNNINQVLIKAMMAKTNADITIVENGLLAFEAVQLELFDLVFMDIHMPVMDGIKANQRIKAILPHIPIVALTANVMDKDVKHYYQQGFIAHVPKPIDINELYGTLRRCLYLNG
ncbi:PAS domain-containing hybrid sensor histidine kinase/response regulator [Pseudoalteromonas sp. 10-33]|uniref:PAS domain-containing hybrid sensor histidine kinase/response regulator n=1 Tax=Pseudoalteromonas sp. 10-33 TaxID=1761890 RepID=UPI00073209AE|nr:PAS domain-containing hybrid sensor histidine kinase/response regulator [Pseudoalteromonas sp. 10-33]KTF10167.1 PAS domain-containing sensor histidine kinase [Pseudoalteromonas sp. 10-33]